MMKRLLCLLLCSILFVACGTTKETKKNAKFMKNVATRSLNLT